MEQIKCCSLFGQRTNEDFGYLRHLICILEKEAKFDVNILNGKKHKFVMDYTAWMLLLIATIILCIGKVSIDNNIIL